MTLYNKVITSYSQTFYKKKKLTLYKIFITIKVSWCFLNILYTLTLYYVSHFKLKGMTRACKLKPHIPTQIYHLQTFLQPLKNLWEKSNTI